MEDFHGKDSGHELFEVLHEGRRYGAQDISTDSPENTDPVICSCDLKRKYAL